MAIHVKSEIGKLKKVMLHRPGQELEHLVPEDLERLLFDDIPYLKTAKIEHPAACKIRSAACAPVIPDILRYVDGFVVTQFLQVFLFR